MRKFIGVKLERELFELIENFAKTKNITISEAVRTVIREYFEGYRHSLDEFIVSKIIANDELFYNSVKAKLLVDEKARVVIKEILKEIT